LFRIAIIGLQNKIALLDRRSRRMECRYILDIGAGTERDGRPPCEAAYRFTSQILASVVTDAAVWLGQFSAVCSSLSSQAVSISG